MAQLTRTQLAAADLDALPPLAELRHLIEQEIPVSAGKYCTAMSATAAVRVAGQGRLVEA